MNILTGDIGGTKTILAVVSSEKGPFDPLLEETFPSASYDSLEAVLDDFLARNSIKTSSACFGIAGPVIAGQGRVTNLPWIMSVDTLQSGYGWQKVSLINDLEAVAWAVPILRPADLLTLNPGERVPGGNIAVIAPGTGLGEAFLTNDLGHYKAHASEGGHTSFGPVGKLQIGLLNYMNNQGFDHVSYERVCSGGLGIPVLYEYLAATGLYVEPDWLAQELQSSTDPTPVIFNAALDPSRGAEIARATLSLFVEILASETGNLALKVLSTGGIYIGGGIPPRILSELQKPYFLENLRDKGRFTDLVTRMPVHVILNPKAGLLGAAAFGLEFAA